jgi:murein DD-endopeptidase MepM/ murein hydrolase activator NlpD
MPSKLTVLAVPSLVGLALAGATLTPAFAAPLADAPAPAHVEKIRFQHGEVLHPVPHVLPVDHYELTGRFGDTSGLWSTVHTGLDFAAPYGTDIRSVTAGVVVSSAYDGSYGLKTVVRAPDGTVLWYCHQSDASVSPGQHVEPGDLIGAIGDSGNTTGPHLHLEVHPHGGDPVDPEVALRHWGLRP